MTLVGSGLVAILAGSDQLPVLLSDSLRRKGQDHRILAFRGFAAPATRDRADAVVDLVDVQRTKRLLEEWCPSAVIFAGAVRRPQTSAVLNALSAFRNRRELAALYGLGAKSRPGRAGCSSRPPSSTRTFGSIFRPSARAPCNAHRSG